MTAPNTSSLVSAVPLSGNYLVDALVEGIKWGADLGAAASLTYSFPFVGAASPTFADSLTAPYSSLEEPNSAIHPFTPGQQTATETALGAWAAVANLGFTQVPDNGSQVGDLRFAFTSVPNQNTWGWAYSPSARPDGGDVWVNYAGVGPKEAMWEPDGVNYESILHEIGHALGLKHTFEGVHQLPPAMDNMLYSVMSYSPAPNDIFFRTITLPDGHQTSVIETIMPDTPMVADIAAIQYLYGANMTYHTGDDVYTFDPHQPFYRTIWDAGGHDTISVANFTDGCTIDLRAGHYSSISIHSDPLPPGSINYYAPTYDGGNNLGIAYGVTIEDATGGAGNDTLIGNDANNTFVGGGGDDAIDGGGGVNTACFSGPRAAYAIQNAGGQITVSDSRGIDGTDTLTNIQRLSFCDGSVAFDLGGNAGLVARAVGAVFGPSYVGDAEYTPLGLQLLDGGMPAEQLMELAIRVRVGAAASHKEIVDLLYQNVTGSTPNAAAEAYYADLLDSNAMSVGQLGLLAANLPQNAVRVDLVGLAADGLHYGGGVPDVTTS